MTEVVAAVIINGKNEIFCARRKDEGLLALKWEFPGGKIEEGESHKEALIREIEEEFKTKISVKDFLMTVNYDYDIFKLKMHAYYCEVMDGELTMIEHTGKKWLKKEELMSLDWADADIPIVEKLME